MKSRFIVCKQRKNESFRVYGDLFYEVTFHSLQTTESEVSFHSLKEHTHTHTHKVVGWGGGVGERREGRERRREKMTSVSTAYKQRDNALLLDKPRRRRPCSVEVSCDGHRCTWTRKRRQVTARGAQTDSAARLYYLPVGSSVGRAMEMNDLSPLSSVRLSGYENKSWACTGLFMSWPHHSKEVQSNNNKTCSAIKQNHQALTPNGF